MVTMKDLPNRPRLVLALGSAVTPLAAIEEKLLGGGAGLTPDEVRKLSAREKEQHFTQVVKRLRADEESLAALLRTAFDAQRPSGGYEGVARLAAKGHVDVIVTADVSTRLEDALIARGVPRSRWMVFANGRFPADDLKRALARPHPPLKIVKLYGQYEDRFALDRKELDEFVGAAAPVLEGVFADTVLLVGYVPARDRWPIPEKGRDVYFVGEAEPDPTWGIYNALTARDHDGKNFLVGPHGSFDAFFTHLGDQLFGRGPQGVGLATLQEVGIDVAKFSEEKVQQAFAPRSALPANPVRRAPPPLVEILEDSDDEPDELELAPPPGFASLLTAAEPTVLRVQYDDRQEVSFGIRGGLTFTSSQSERMLYPLAQLNATLANMGLMLAQTYQMTGAAADILHDSWRNLARMEGLRLFEQLFHRNPQLMQKYGMAGTGAGADDDLFLHFAGPRQYLGMPYELLHDGTMPLAVRHPIAREVLGVESPGAVTLGTLFDRLLQENRPLRVLVVAADDPADHDRPADREVGQLRRLIERQAPLVEREGGKRRLAVDVKTLLTDQAALAEVKRVLGAERFDLVHFACHGEFDAEKPERSRLRLRSPVPANPAAGELLAGELHHLLRKHPPHLVFLNSCVGAAVADRPFSDVQGVLDAVVSAGVPTVLGFRWQVAEDGATKFAENFYESLFRRRCPAKATLDARKAIHATDPNDETWASAVLVVQKLD
jgi:hypothetical protein